MWNEAQIAENLRMMGLREGANLVVHASLRAIGPLENGAQTLLHALQNVIGPEGTLLVPLFSYKHNDPADWKNPPETPEDLETARSRVAPFDPRSSLPDVASVGYFAEWVRQQKEAHRTQVSPLAFAAIGRNAEFLTANAPYHFPLGSESPLARLHQIDGWILLLGVGQDRNASLHLAEVWANVPYAHRKTEIKTAPAQWDTRRGNPQCSDGFVKIQTLLNQSRIARHGMVGRAPSQLLRQRQAVSMAITMLQGDSCSLLCNDNQCEKCRLARKLCGTPA